MIIKKHGPTSTLQKKKVQCTPIQWCSYLSNAQLKNQRHGKDTNDRQAKQTNHWIVLLCFPSKQSFADNVCLNRFKIAHIMHQPKVIHLKAIFEPSSIDSKYQRIVIANCATNSSWWTFLHLQIWTISWILLLPLLTCLREREKGSKPRTLISLHGLHHIFIRIIGF